MNLMTIMYICIQETLNDPDVTDTVHAKLRECPFLRPQLMYARALMMGSRVEPLSYRLYDDSNV